MLKYHIGLHIDSKCDNGKEIKLSLSPNPSHLEAVDPVVQGITRAKIEKTYNSNFNKIIPILIHGDNFCCAKE